MSKYAAMFHAEIHADNQKAVMEIITRIENTVACCGELSDAWDNIVSFDMDDCELLEAEDD